MVFEKHIKVTLKIFFKKKYNGLKGHMWLLIMWLDPIFIDKLNTSRGELLEKNRKYVSKNIKCNILVVG